MRAALVCSLALCSLAARQSGAAGSFSYSDASAVGGDASTASGAPRPDEISPERRRCLAQVAMDSKIFPPETHGDASLRGSFAGLPAVGDLFLTIKDIYVTLVDFELTMGRKSDTVFSFKVAGRGGAPKARIEAFIDGLDFIMPQSSLGGLVKGMSGFDNVISNIFTFGLAGDRGRVDRTPIDLGFSMSADFKTDESYSWSLVKGSQQQSVSFSLLNGGIVPGIVTDIIAKAGGIDTIFFNVVWPLVQKMLPSNIAAAFQAVPHNVGQLSHTVAVRGVCPSEDKRRCSSNELKISVEESTVIRMRPEPIFRTAIAMEQKRNQSSLWRDVVEGIVLAYDQGQDVVKGWVSTAVLGVDLAEDQTLTMVATPNINVPLAFLKAVLPVGGVDSFAPAQGKLRAFGSAALAKGVARFPRMGVQNLSLPVGADQQLLFSATLEGFTAEVESDTATPVSESEVLLAEAAAPVFKAPGSKVMVRTVPLGTTVLSLGRVSSDGKDYIRLEEGCVAPAEAFRPVWPGDLIFSPLTPLAVDAPGVEAAFARLGGVSLGPQAGKDAVRATVQPEFIRGQLLAAGRFTRSPSNVRTGDSRAADGAVPSAFAQPPARMPLILDFPRFFKQAKARITTALESSSDGGNRLLEASATLSLNSTLLLGRKLWRALIDGHDSDHGYLSFTSAGTYGRLGGGRQQPPTEAALLWLNCATVMIYRARSGEQPFEREAEVILDLTQAADYGKLTSNRLTLSGGLVCLTLDANSQYFCGPGDTMASLDDALRLQKDRLQDAAKRWPATCRPGPDSKESCLGKPDGTWFTEFQPWNVTTHFPSRVPPDLQVQISSPTSIWKQLLRV